MCFCPVGFAGEFCEGIFKFYFFFSLSLSVACEGQLATVEFFHILSRLYQEPTALSCNIVSAYVLWVASSPLEVSVGCCQVSFLSFKCLYVIKNLSKGQKTQRSDKIEIPTSYTDILILFKRTFFFFTLFTEVLATTPQTTTPLDGELTSNLVLLNTST